MCTPEDWENVARIRELELRIRHKLDQRALLRAELRAAKQVERERRRVLEQIDTRIVGEDAARAAAAEALEAAQQGSENWQVALRAVEDEISELRGQQAELIVEPYGFRP